MTAPQGSGLDARSDTPRREAGGIGSAFVPDGEGGPARGTTPGRKPCMLAHAESRTTAVIG